MDNIKIVNIKNKNLFLNLIKSHNLHMINENRSGILKDTNHKNMRVAVITEDLNKKIVGCACSSKKYSCQVYVLPAYRGLGIAKKLIDGMDVSKVDKRENLKHLWKYGKNYRSTET